MPVAIGQLSITHLRDGSTSEDQYASNTSLTVAPASGWSSAVPPPQVGSYVWKRSRAAHADGTYGSWGEAVRITGAIGQPGEAGPEGPAGPPGNPGAIGIYAEGTTLHVKGYAADGTLSASQGYIYVGTSRTTVPACSLNLTTHEGKGYALLSGSTILFARIKDDGDDAAWFEYTGGGLDVSGCLVIGSFMKVGPVISNMKTINPLSVLDFQQIHFMEILATNDFSKMDAWAQANGIGQVFRRIATLEAFVSRLVANNIEIISSSGLQFQAMKDVNSSGADNPIFKVSYDGDRLFEVDPVTGKIYFGDYFWYDPDGKAIKSANNKVVIGSDGIIHAEDGVFSGTVNAVSGKFSGDLDIAPANGKLLQLLSSLGTLLQWTTSTHASGQALYNTLSATIAPNMDFNTTGSVQIQQPAGVSAMANTTSPNTYLGMVWLNESTVIGYTTAWSSNRYLITMYKSADHGVTWVQKAQVSSHLRYISWDSAQQCWIILRENCVSYCKVTSEGSLSDVSLNYTSSWTHDAVDLRTTIVRNSCPALENNSLLLVAAEHATRVQIFGIRYGYAPSNSYYTGNYVTRAELDSSTHSTANGLILVSSNTAHVYKRHGYDELRRQSAHLVAYSAIDSKSLISIGANIQWIQNDNLRKSLAGSTVSTLYYHGSASSNAFHAATANNTNLTVRPDSGASEYVGITVSPKIERIFLSGGNIRILARTYSASGSTYTQYQIALGSITSVSATKFQYKKYGSGASEKIVIRLNNSNTTWVSILFGASVPTTSSLSATGIGKIENFDYIEATTVYGARFN